MIRHLVNRLLPELRSIAVEVQGLAADVRALRHEVTVHRAALERLLGCPPDRIPPEVQHYPSFAVPCERYAVYYDAKNEVFRWRTPQIPNAVGHAETLQGAIAAAKAAVATLDAAVDQAERREGPTDDHAAVERAAPDSALFAWFERVEREYHTRRADEYAAKVLAERQAEAALGHPGYCPCARCGRDVDLSGAHLTIGDAPVHHDCGLDAEEEGT